MKRLLYALTLSLFPMFSHATHIIGGELNYKCLGGNLYEIHLRVYRDCYNGVPDFDKPAAVGIFDANNNLVTTVYLTFPGKQKLDPTVNRPDPCVIIPQDVCVEATEYVGQVNLPPIPGGYQLAYQRCCRNQTIVNLVNPGNVGATYYATIPDQSVVTCNSNPVFTEWPPIFVCQNMDIAFDHSATDGDGDSIVYRLCWPFNGATSGTPMPQPPNAPPYQNVPWQSPYNTNDPLGGIPLSIDPQTGWLTGTPDKLGQYVVGICADEYRNGVLISTTKRDFQFNVLECESDVVASALSITINCATFTVQFINNSTGAVSYFWNFGDPTTTADTSGLVNPTYTYPGVGTYLVTLIAFSGTDPACNDTITNLFTLVDSCRPCSMNLTASKTDADCNAGGNCNVSGPICSVNIFAPDTMWHYYETKLINGSCAQIHCYVRKGTGCNSFSSSGSCNASCNGVPLPNPTYSKCDTVWPGGKKGTGTVTPTGGNAPYIYTWNSGQTTQSITGLDPGIYCVTVGDASGSCVDSICITVAAGGNMNLNLSSTPISNCGMKDGSVTTTPSGGNAPYTYRWIPGGYTTQSLTGLGPGTYTVLVTDQDSCSTVGQITITDPVTVTANLTATPVGCSYGADGTITLNTTGGSTPFTYQWSPGGYTTQNLTGLPPGYYQVTVTDANGCKGTAGIDVTRPVPITATTNKTDALCFGGNEGSGTVNASGGTPGYTYLWNTAPAQTGSTATGLSRGTYQVIITDANGCKDTAQVTIAEPAPVSPEAQNTTQSGCSGSVAGSADVLVSGGTPPFTYLWCNGQTTQQASGLSAGTCGITVTDANGCTASDNVDIVFPPAISASTFSQNLLCYGDGLGSITASHTGGRPGYTYIWTPGGYTTQNVNGIPPGTYFVTVTDADGCTDTSKATISQPPALVPLIAGTGTSCVGANDGKATSSVTGGTPGYLFQWDTKTGNQTTQTATGLAPGTYTVRITDANGCDTVVATSIIDGAAPPVAGFTYNPTPQCEGVLFAFSNTSTNATGYYWDLGNGTTSSQPNPQVFLPYGNQGYTVTLIASNGSNCADTFSVVVNPGLINNNFIVPNVFTPNKDGKNDCFYIPVIPGLDNCGELIVFNRWGIRIYDNKFGICWDGRTDTGYDAPEGTYYFLYKLGDFVDLKGWVALVRNQN